MISKRPWRPRRLQTLQAGAQARLTVGGTSQHQRPCITSILETLQSGQWRLVVIKAWFSANIPELVTLDTRPDFFLSLKNDLQIALEVKCGENWVFIATATTCILKAGRTLFILSFDRGWRFIQDNISTASRRSHSLHCVAGVLHLEQR